MSMFPDYQPSAARSPRHIQTGLNLGLAPVGVSLLLILARPGWPGPFLWSMFLVSLGLVLIYRGCVDLPRKEHKTLPVFTRLAARCDAWFPLFLFVMQNVFCILTFAILWVQILDIGLAEYTQWWHHLILGFVIFLFPFRRGLLEYLRDRDIDTDGLVEQGLRYLTWIIGAVFLTGTLTPWIVSATQGPQKAPVGLVVLWVPATLIVITCLFLFTEHLVTFLGRRRRLQPPEDGPGRG